jgi:hypothetical protein
MKEIVVRKSARGSDRNGDSDSESSIVEISPKEFFKLSLEDKAGAQAVRRESYARVAPAREEYEAERARKDLITQAKITSLRGGRPEVLADWILDIFADKEGKTVETKRPLKDPTKTEKSGVHRAVRIEKILDVSVEKVKRKRGDVEKSKSIGKVKSKEKGKNAAEDDEDWLDAPGMYFHDRSGAPLGIRDGYEKDLELYFLRKIRKNGKPGQSEELGSIGFPPLHALFEWEFYHGDLDNYVPIEEKEARCKEELVSAKLGALYDYHFRTASKVGDARLKQELLDAGLPATAAYIFPVPGPSAILLETRFRAELLVVRPWARSVKAKGNNGNVDV